MNNRKYVPGKIASEMAGLSQQTLRKYGDSGLIDMVRTKGGPSRSGMRLYNIKKFLADKDESEDDTDYKYVCYCRVSTHGQADDLTRQVKYMSENYKDYEIITDIGSGINFKRKGLRQIMDYATEGCLAELVLTYRDRLCRIGWDMLEYLMTTHSDTNIIIENEDEERTPSQEISDDIIQIITVYSAKINGKRSHKNKKKATISN
jgi:predicted site-specific integrase-resolvase